MITTEYLKLEVKVKDGTLSTKVEEYYENMHDIAPDDHVMTIQEFVQASEENWISTYDGFGHYIIGNKITNARVFSDDPIPTAATGVVWYNK